MDKQLPSGFGQTPAESSSKQGGQSTGSDEQSRINITGTHGRVGWPQLVPLPATMHDQRPHAHIAPYSQVKASIDAVLSSEQIRVDVARFGLRKAIGSTSPPRLTFMLISSDQAAESWFHAVLRISRLIQDAKVDPQQLIAVEIIDTDVMHPQLLPIGKHDNLLQVWDAELAPALIRQLEKSTAAWSLLSLVRLKSRSDEKHHPPIVLLEVADALDSQWESLSKTLNNMAMQFQCVVEVWQSSLMLSMQPNCGRLPMRMWDSTMHMGDGIAPTGAEYLGTLGGFITLETPSGKQHTFGLTNFHVIKDSPGLKDLLAPKPPRTTLTAYNFTYNPSSHSVSVPADRDTEGKREYLEEEIAGFRRRVTARSRPGEAPTICERVELGDEKAHHQMEVAKKQIADREQDLASLQDNTKYHAGTLKAVSGCSVAAAKGDSNLALDWALINIDDARDYSLYYPFSDMDKPCGTPRPDWLFGSLSQWVPLSRSSEHLFKVGRQSGWSTGIFNHADSYVSLVRNRAQDWEEAFGTVARCHRVEGLIGNDPFAIPGDSGSLVLDGDTGACVGLLFGADDFNGYGLFTEADVLFNSIEEVTGCKVVRPREVHMNNCHPPLEN